MADIKTKDQEVSGKKAGNIPRSPDKKVVTGRGLGSQRDAENFELLLRKPEKTKQTNV